MTQTTRTPGARTTNEDAQRNAYATAVARATFVVVGAGGLGCPLALGLAAAGAGRIVLVDDDVVELSNLQRQILFRTADIGRPKVTAAAEALVRRGVPAARIEAVRARFTEDTARGLLHDATVVCDGTDSLETKFLVNDAAIAMGKPFAIGGVLRDRGQLFAVRPAGTDGATHACYRCLFEAPPTDDGPTCADAGVLGATCGVVGAAEAQAAVALATGIDPLGFIGKVWLFERGRARSLEVHRRPDCPACGSVATNPGEPS